MCASIHPLPPPNSPFALSFPISSPLPPPPPHSEHSLLTSIRTYVRTKAALVGANFASSAIKEGGGHQCKCQMEGLMLVATYTSLMMVSDVAMRNSVCLFHLHPDPFFPAGEGEGGRDKKSLAIVMHAHIIADRSKEGGASRKLCPCVDTFSSLSIPQPLCM